MAEADEVVSLPARLPATVRLQRGMSLTPNEMRMLKEKTGRSLTELLGGDLEDLDAAPDRMQALVWVELRRQGFDPSWEDAGDIVPEFVEQEPDPTSGGRSPSSPASVDSGG
jgi:hypothetical protein